MSHHQHFDVVVASDLRLPGGTTASLAEEIRAQAAAGYRTALMHVNSRLSRKFDLGLDARIRQCVDEGLAVLLTPDDSVTARLALLRNGTVFESTPQAVPTVRADSVALVVNNVAVDASGVRHFVAATVDDVVTGLFGTRPVWFPIGPAVRDSLFAERQDIDLSSSDWVNLIDVDEWTADRAPLGERIPVIGRHSRSHPAKWPEDPAALLAAYPDDDSVRVRVLGGAEAVAGVLGRIPDRWVVEEFGARDPRDFVAQLDFFVYFHRSDLVEAYGRTIMEAMASGAVVILPATFEPTFGDAALYRTPAEVRDTVRELCSDPDGYAAQVRLARSFVARTHGYQVHVERLEARIGAPSSAPLVLRSRRRRRDRCRVLFVSSNGAGMGHLTRLLAMATRASPRVEPIFFSMSQAVPIVSTFGFPWEYCPSRGDLGTTAEEWNPLFEERFLDVMRRYGPQAVVFDGTMPYQGMVNARRAFPDVLFVWSRRGMWRQDTTTKFLARGSVFDIVIEPGEIAASLDRGPTAARTDAHRVGPVTLVREAQMLTRDRARSELGIDASRPALLLSLGAGNINDIEGDLQILIEAAKASDVDWQICLTKAPIASRADDPSADSITIVRVYPLAKFFAAFDAAVVAAGYNSFHEVALAGVPAAFVPNTSTITDDQVARAAYADSSGMGVRLDQVDPASAARTIARLEQLAFGAELRSSATFATTIDGAGEAMKMIEAELGRRGVLA